MQIINRIKNSFRPVLEKYVDDPVPHLERITASRDPELGDFQANLAMPLAKPLGRDATELAEEMIGALDVSEFCDDVSVAGRGFINLRLSDEWIAKQISRVVNDSRLGVACTKEPLTVIVDFSSPNVAKSMHVGHIRSTVIGDSIARTLRFLGHKVITDNHLGDWGTQFGMVIYGYKNFVNTDSYADAPVAELSRLYKKIQGIITYQKAIKNIDGLIQTATESESRLQTAKDSLTANPEDKKAKKALKQAEKAAKSAQAAVESTKQTISNFESETENHQISQQHPDIEQRCLQETAALHDGDKTNRDLWNQFMPVCLAEIHRVYDRLNIEFDYEYGESFYHDMLDNVVKKLESDGVAKTSDGAICVFLDGYDAPMIIRKQDGAFLYATTDLATVDYRLAQFSPDKVLYVVDHRQGEHFGKIFATCKLNGINDVDFRHVAFGTVLGTDGKPFKTRSGDQVGLDLLLDEAVERARAVACNPERLAAAKLELNEDELNLIADRVGIGAIKYADLSHNRMSDYKFDLDKMVQLEGNTAAYIQYSYARTRSILTKSESSTNPQDYADAKIVISKPIERELALQILRFEEFLQQSLIDFTPNTIAGYLFDLARIFSSFYDQCRVVGAESQSIADSRKALVLLSGEVLKCGLDLLGIETVERM